MGAPLPILPIQTLLKTSLGTCKRIAVIEKLNLRAKQQKKGNANMKRFHIHVGVTNLEKSIQFYSTLFGEKPVKLKSDYAKWMLEDPKLNFAISTRSKEQGGRPPWNSSRSLRRINRHYATPKKR